MKLTKSKSELMLVLGLAFVFIWFGVEKIVITENWLGYMPAAFEGLLGQTQVFWTQFIGIVEIILGAGLLWPKTRKIAAILMALHLVGVIFSLGLNEITIRDIGLLFMALSTYFYGPR